MYNDSVETLLLRHYGGTAVAPALLQQRLLKVIRRDDQEIRRQQRVTSRIRELRLSRRRAVQLVAIGSAGLGFLTVALESLDALEQGVFGQDISQTAFP
jgi:hypothetical protein